MTASDQLRRARARIERGWTQGALARDARGRPTQADDAEAEQWDCLGAFDGPLGASPRAVSLLREVVGQAPLTWNDAPGWTKTEVLAAFDQAIAMAEAEERP